MRLTDNLSANLKLNEFISTVPNDFQLSLLKLIAGELQKVRNWINTQPANDWRINPSMEIGINISNGVRTVNDFMRLKGAGYNPSKSSDHFYGFAPYFAAPTLGAADVTFSNCKKSLYDVHEAICKLAATGAVSFGQIIYEKGKNSPWIHFGNEWTKIFKDEITGNTRKRFLQSLDNGVTYTERVIK